MKVSNEQVAIAWSRNRTAENHKGSYHTDGMNLHSYTTRIGYTENGKKILLDFTSATGNFLSMTTSSKHLPPARKVADETINPSEA